MDKTLARLAEKIEKLRNQMHKHAGILGIAHPDIMRLSCELDKLIVRYQHHTRHIKSKNSTSYENYRAQADGSLECPQK